MTSAGRLLHRCARRRAAIMIGLACSGGGLTAPPASALDRPATPATLRSVFAASEAGDVILLAPGTYGEFRGGLKSGTVTLKPQPGAAVTMDVRFSPASNITLDGITQIRDLYLADSRTKNITVRNSRFNGGQAVIRGGAGDLANANVVFDGNVHSNFDVCSGCYAGRVHIAEHTAEPIGVTVQNSVFSGGNGDGIQSGGNGVRILNNEFRDMHQGDPDVAHTDSIQLYGSKSTLIKGNWFHDVAVGIMCADGCDHETIEDNVFAVDGSPYAVTLLSDNGSTINHNTFVGHGTCDYRQRCGVLYLGNKSGDPASAGTRLRDNIMTRICVCAGSSSGLADEDYNVLASGGSGSHDERGEPSYLGGAAPSSYAGFTLAAGSLGKGSASDGLDRGAHIDARPGTGSPASSTRTDVHVRVLSKLRSVAATGNLRLEVRVDRPATLVVGARIRPRAAKRGIGERAHVGRSQRVIELKTIDLGRRKAGAHKLTMRLTRAARRVLTRAHDARVSVRISVDSGPPTVTKITISR